MKMKKLILMSLTLFAFAFTVGCGKPDPKADCEEDDTKMWDEEKEECVDKEEKEKEVTEAVAGGTAPTYTVTNKHTTIISVSSGDLEPIQLSKGNCVKVRQSQVATLKIFYSTGPQRTSHLCGQENNACDAKNYDVTAGSLGPQLSLAPVMNASADCKDLGGAKATPAKADTKAGS